MKKNHKNKTVAIFFTSGIDSTYLMWKAMNDPDVECIKPIYVSILNNEAKTKVEKNRIKKIIELFGTYDNAYKIRGIEEYSTNTIGQTGDRQFPQLPSFIFAATSIASNQIHEIWIGYIMNDDATSYINDIKKLWKAHKPFYTIGSLSKLKFPISKINKTELARLLPEKIFQETYTCENPSNVDETGEVFTDCGECQTCGKEKYLGIKRIRNSVASYHLNKMLEPLESMVMAIGDPSTSIVSMSVKSGMKTTKKSKGKSPIDVKVKSKVK